MDKIPQVNLVGSVPWRLRADIEWQDMGQTPEREWLVHDPLTRHLYRFGDFEQAILHRLDGQISLSQLKTWFTERFAPVCVEDEELVRLIRTSAQRGLLLYDGPPYPLRNLGSNKERWAWMAALPWKILSSRVSLGNPEPWLKRIAPAFDWLFAPIAVRFWLVLVVGVMVALLGNWERIWISLPQWEEWIAPSLWLGLGTAFVLTRCFHELGHAILCVRLGARCVDFGWMFMMGVACPYVDVTASWKLRDWRERASISAAGVYVELVLASLAGIYWMWTIDGPLHQLAWQILLVSSMSILFFNANPLMRYDGYYVLCDWIGQPNLRDHADRAFRNCVWNLAFGTRHPLASMGCKLSQRHLVMFGGCTTFYRLLFVVGIMASILATASHWKMMAIGILLAGLVLISGVLIPILNGIETSWKAAHRGEQSRIRTCIVWSSVAILFVMALVVPLPRRLACRGQLMSRDMASLRTQVGNAPAVGITELAWTVRCELDAGRLADISIGQPARIRLLHNPWKVWDAEVRSMIPNLSTSEDSNGRIVSAPQWLELNVHLPPDHVVLEGSVDVVIREPSKSLWRSFWEWAGSLWAFRGTPLVQDALCGPV